MPCCSSRSALVEGRLESAGASARVGGDDSPSLLLAIVPEYLDKDAEI